MNKAFASVVVGLVLGAASAVSASDVSIGGGGFFASDFGGGTEYKAKGSFPYQGANVTIDNEATTKAPWVGGGAFLFLDANYVEAFVGFTAGGGKWKQESKQNQTISYGGQSQSNNDSDSEEADVSFSALNFGYLLKLPIALSDKITFFPAAGIDYQLSVGGKLTYTEELGPNLGDTTITIKWDGEDGPDADYFSALMFKFGVGFDFGLTETIYLRSELLYGIRLASLIEKSMQGGGYIPDEVKDQVDVTGPRTRLGHGLTVKVGLGFRL